MTGWQSQQTSVHESSWQRKQIKRILDDVQPLHNDKQRFSLVFWRKMLKNRMHTHDGMRCRDVFSSASVSAFKIKWNLSGILSSYNVFIIHGFWGDLNDISAQKKTLSTACMATLHGSKLWHHLENHAFKLLNIWLVRSKYPKNVKFSFENNIIDFTATLYGSKFWQVFELFRDCKQRFVLAETSVRSPWKHYVFLILHSTKGPWLLEQTYHCLVWYLERYGFCPSTGTAVQGRMSVQSTLNPIINKHWHFQLAVAALNQDLSLLQAWLEVW